ncbi:hypothetical protein ADUPG1_008972 [Aduncisulcus paluster]|uniref:Uncharacterized protein n=1 Tax=Aduncisulcus paluster TaxID=2918883 RepID=A0ABQ5KWT0_9EUKA|nr:hypothetical protein ADUPG1_008972 [Aduncisulcus paluster]
MSGIPLKVGDPGWELVEYQLRLACVTTDIIITSIHDVRGDARQASEDSIVWLPTHTTDPSKLDSRPVKVFKRINLANTPSHGGQYEFYMCSSPSSDKAYCMEGEENVRNTKLPDGFSCIYQHIPSFVSPAISQRIKAAEQDIRAPLLQNGEESLILSEALKEMKEIHADRSLRDISQSALAALYGGEVTYPSGGAVTPMFLVSFTVDQDRRLKESLCDNCNERIATLYCDSDKAKLCPECDAHIHSVSRIASRHKRVPLTDHPSFFGNCKHHPDQVCTHYDFELDCALCVKCKMEGTHAVGENATHKLVELKEAYDQAKEASTKQDRGISSRCSQLRSRLREVDERMREVCRNSKEIEEELFTIVRKAVNSLRKATSKKIALLISDELRLERDLIDIGVSEQFLQVEKEELNPVEFMRMWKEHQRLRDKVREKYDDEKSMGSSSFISTLADTSIQGHIAVFSNGQICEDDEGHHGDDHPRASTRHVHIQQPVQQPVRRASPRPHTSASLAEVGSAAVHSAAPMTAATNPPLQSPTSTIPEFSMPVWDEPLEEHREERSDIGTSGFGDSGFGFEGAGGGFRATLFKKSKKRKRGSKGTLGGPMHSSAMFNSTIMADDIAVEQTPASQLTTEELGAAGPHQKLASMSSAEKSVMQRRLGAQKDGTNAFRSFGERFATMAKKKKDERDEQERVEREKREKAESVAADRRVGESTRTDDDDHLFSTTVGSSRGPVGAPRLPKQPKMVAHKPPTSSSVSMPAPAADFRHARLTTEAEARRQQMLKAGVQISSQPFVDSSILTTSFAQLLYFSLPYDFAPITLNLYNSKDFGMNLQTLQAVSSDNGATCIIIKCGERVFGGFASQSWSMDGKPFGDSNSFLFSLDGNFKLKCKTHRDAIPQYGDSTRLSFGVTDLVLAGEELESCISEVEDSYTIGLEPGSVQAQTLLAGRREFQPDAIEVWKFSMPHE